MSDAPNVYTQDGITYIRASALGGCPRALVAAAQGYTPLPPPAQTERYWAEGHLHEPSVLRYLENEYASPVTDAQKQVELGIRSDVAVRGHLDGRQNGRIVEVKTMSRDEYEKWQRGVDRGDPFREFARYSWQLSSYMYAEESPARVAVKNRNNGEIMVTEIMAPPRTLEEITTRATSIADARSLPDCSDTWFPCPFVYLHEEDVVLVEDTVIDALSEEYDRARTLVEKYEKVRKEVRERILEALGVRGEDSLTTANVKVTKTISTRETFDLKLAREHKLDLPPQYIRKSVSEQLRVTRRERNGQEED